MEHDKVAALRRVAIVLSSLPDATASRLIMSLSNDQQRAVRLALSSLSDVDPLERRRALDGFATSIRRGKSPLAAQCDAAEIVLSQTALHHRGSQPAFPPPTASDRSAACAPLAFLSDIDDSTLADRIGGEHPQTIAIILASIAPAQAARILSKLSVATRSETMRRLGKLNTPSPEIVADIGNQLKSILLATGGGFAGASALGAAAHSVGSGAGQAALQAILAEMPENDARPLPTAPRGFDHDKTAPLRGSLDELQTSATVAAAREPLSEPAIDPSPTNSITGRDSPSVSAAAIHDRLVALPAERLRQALASVPTRVSLLALCGLPSATAEQVLGSLPRRQARQIRKQLTDLGSLEFHEIDRAKAAVASAADKLQQGEFQTYSTLVGGTGRTSRSAAA